MSSVEIDREPVLISTGKVTLTGSLAVPADAKAVIIVANGLGRVREPIAQPLASVFNEEGFATLLFDLLTPDELQFDSRTSHFSGDIGFQCGRLLDVVEWIQASPSIGSLRIIGMAAGAAARGLLRAAGMNPGMFQALIIDGGVRKNDVPTGLGVPALLLEDDDPLQLKRARAVADALQGPRRLEIIPAAMASGPVDPFFSDLSARTAATWLRSVVRD